MKAKSTARWIGLVGIAIALTLFLASSAAHAEDDTIGANGNKQWWSVSETEGWAVPIPAGLSDH